MRRLIIFLMVFLMLLSFVQAKNEKYYYERLELNMPNDMKYQPLDISIEFDKPCYAVNEREHSITVLYNGREIESQIYNLEFKSKNVLQKCNIVFLYQGKGEYIIRYGEEMEEKFYEDHVVVKDSFYYVEPLPGYFASVNYYEIRDDGKSIFGICQEGSILGIEMGNKVIKMVEDAEKFEMKNWRQIFSFALFHSDGGETGSDEKLVSKEILVDGNLMARIALQTVSKDGKLSTAAIYTYYHSPTNEKRLFVKLEHESKAAWQGNATYAYFAVVKARSKTIEELNMGEILPYIHLNGKEGVEEYKFDTNPEYKEKKWIISAADDVTLGDPPWIAIDDKSKAYAFILSSSDNLQVTAAVKEEIGVPGLEVDGGGISIGKYGEIKSGEIYEGTIEVFCGKFEGIAKEAKAFQSFQNFRQLEGIWKKGREEEKYNLTVILHFHHSIPFFASLSAFFGIKLPYIEVEVWNNESMVAKASVGFRKAWFELPAGFYNVRVYYRGLKERKYIGYECVNLQGDAKLRIPCTFEGKLRIKTKEGAKIRIVDKGIVEEKISDGEEMIIQIPSLHRYKIYVIYKGSIVTEDEVFLVFLEKREYEFQTYDFSLIVEDTLGMEPGVNFSCFMENYEMLNEYIIEGKERDKKFLFQDLPAGEYRVVTKYKSFRVEKNVRIPEQRQATILFPAEYRVKVKVYDERGFPIKARIVFERKGVKIEGNELPPARYMLRIYYGSSEIAKKEIFISSESTYEIVTKRFSFYPYIIPILAIIILVWRRKIEEAIAFLLSLSFIFPWWKVKGDAVSSLYIFPPKMIEMHENYGSMIALPHPLPSILLITLFLTVIGFIMIYFVRFRKFAFLPLLFSIIIFSYAIKKFADATVGSIVGEDIINGEHTTWGLGIGFYLALLSFILLAVKVTYHEIRRGS